VGLRRNRGKGRPRTLSKLATIATIAASTKKAAGGITANGDHGGGFGVVILDLCDASPETLRRIPLPWWYRFRRAVESTPSILAIAGTQSIAGSCASCVIEMERRGIRWSGSAQVPVLDGIDFRAASRKPVRAATRSALF
jgi:hypothetical protein